MFVTGRGGAGFHSQGPALTRGRGGYFSRNPRLASTRGRPALIPWTGPRLLPPTFNGDPSGVWVGRGPERGQGQGIPKKTPGPRPLSGAGGGKGPRGRVFWGPVCPVTNSRLVIMLCNYPPLRYSQESHTITILLLLLSTFAAFPLFSPKAMTTTPIEEAPMDEFYTWTLGPDEIIDLFPISSGRMKVDFFFL